MNNSPDYARIRALAAEVAVIATVSDDRLKRLEEIYDLLYEQLPYADPLRDREFEQFLLRLRRSITRLRVDCDLAQVARRMQTTISAPKPMITLEAAHA